jgi:hypothetical protein
MGPNALLLCKEDKEGPNASLLCVTQRSAIRTETRMFRRFFKHSIESDGLRVSQKKN